MFMQKFNPDYKGFRFDQRLYCYTDIYACAAHLSEADEMVWRGSYTSASMAEEHRGRMVCFAIQDTNQSRTR